MTLEQLLECDAATLAKLTDKELLAFFEPYLKVTRPELAEKPKKSPQRAVQEYKPRPVVHLSPLKQKALEALAADGEIDMEFLRRQMRNKKR